MEFRKSILISSVLHLCVLFLISGFSLVQIETDWIEVSIIAFPDLKESIPDWETGKRIEPEPSKEVYDALKNELPAPVRDTEMGIPVEAESPEMPEIREEYQFVPSLDEFEKIMPGRKERRGETAEPGRDDNLVISGPVTRRQLIRKVYPKYPAWAEEKGIEGKVDLKFWVSAEGMVMSVEIIKTSGYPDLDSRAMEALKKYLFSPLGKEEEQQSQWGTITIKYTLK